jgi:hypothetical protein
MSTKLHTAAARSCYWAPDYSSLSLLKPMPGRVLAIGPSMLLGAAEPPAEHSVAASTIVVAGLNVNAITSGLWVPEGANQAVMFESISAGLQTNDTTKSLTVLDIHCDIGDGVSLVPLNGTSGTPFAMVGQGGLSPFWYVWSAVLPPILLIPRSDAGGFDYSTPGNGPTFVVSLQNTDGANAHNFSMRVQFTYRLIDNVDFTTGASIPGSGMSGEFA